MTFALFIVMATAALTAMVLGGLVVLGELERDSWPERVQRAAFVVAILFCALGCVSILLDGTP